MKRVDGKALSSSRQVLGIAAVCLVIFVAVGLAGCSKGELKVGASDVPHAEILEFIKPLLEKEGVKMTIIVFDDYVQPNLQLADKQLDANYFQHIPYLEEFSASRKLDLTWACKVHIEPMGVYSSRIESLSELGQKAKVGIPNDVTNGGRALALLENAGLLKLKDGLGVKATLLDIEENPRELEIVELSAEMLPHALPDLDCAVINGNYAIQAGLSPVEDSLFLESKESPYANVLAVRKGDEDKTAIKKLVKLLQSPEVKSFIEEKYGGGVVPAF